MREQDCCHGKKDYQNTSTKYIAEIVVVTAVVAVAFLLFF